MKTSEILVIVNWLYFKLEPKVVFFTKIEYMQAKIDKKNMPSTIQY